MFNWRHFTGRLNINYFPYWIVLVSTGTDLFCGERSLKIDRSIKCRHIGLEWELHTPSDGLLSKLNIRTSKNRLAIHVLWTNCLSLYFLTLDIFTFFVPLSSHIVSSAVTQTATWILRPSKLMGNTLELWLWTICWIERPRTSTNLLWVAYVFV